MKIIGKSTINPFFFYTGKISGYSTWILLILSICRTLEISMISFSILRICSFIILVPGVVLSILSIFNLGKSTSLGLPDEETFLVETGLYNISRNPMYTGFNLLTFSSILYIQNLFIFVVGLYSVLIYHFIILSEERFLEDRFGTDYSNYKSNVKRYL